MMHSHCCLQLNRLKPLVVLILVVMDDALALYEISSKARKVQVLILVVMDDALALRYEKF